MGILREEEEEEEGQAAVGEDQLAVVRITRDRHGFCNSSVACCCSCWGERERGGVEIKKDVRVSFRVI